MYGSADDSGSQLSFMSLFGVMVFTMMLSFLPYLVQYDTYGGNRRSDMERERKAFDEGVDSKISKPFPSNLSFETRVVR
jgi:hypothetical protein